MATSAFKSTTKRTPIRGSSSSEDSSGASRSLRRSRSLSRFSRPVHPEHETERPVPDYNKSGPRGKFVNTARGSAAFPEISLDDLALEFFGSSSRTENESDGGVRERKGREGRSVGRWASDTASSRRRGRSVSRSRGDSISNSSAFEGNKIVSSSDAGSRRRRSLSVARHQISDSESEVDYTQSSRKHSNVKASTDGNNQMHLSSSNRRLGRSRSHKDLSISHDGYSSQSSVLTDDESKDTRFGRNGIEKTIRTVYAQKKAEHPTEDVPNGGLYEAMRKELRHAVQEIRTELNQAMGRNQAALTSGDSLQSDNSETLPDLSVIRKIYTSKFEQFEKNKVNLSPEMLEEQQGRDAHKIVKELSDTRTSALEEQHSQARKRSSNRNQMSKQLSQEAERYFEGFISNVDTDISSLDGERSDGSSTLGGKERDTAINRNGPYSTARSVPSPIEMDGVNLPWLLWETSPDCSLSGNNNAEAPVTPKFLHWDSEKDVVGSRSVSSQGSWSPGRLFGIMKDRRGDKGATRKAVDSLFDMAEYVKLPNNEEVLFEMYRQRNRINSGCLFICSTHRL
ncbi:hypothetical protein F511_18769 [Dorcoceras hygrometricum]|uniref:Uncharacterized protein n=1 Tax=Dorcoceras hygrometricum TaxID=472368 RepID=A0A2Z7DKZ7_9LAMI|nr:hypothetical protein F511_18769 [Dorcoceras hygrometricum]